MGRFAGRGWIGGIFAFATLSSVLRALWQFSNGTLDGVQILVTGTFVAVLALKVLPVPLPRERPPGTPWWRDPYSTPPILRSDDEQLADSETQPLGPQARPLALLLAPVMCLPPWTVALMMGMNFRWAAASLVLILLAYAGAFALWPHLRRDLDSPRF